MRTILIVMFALLSLPAFAQDSARYEDAQIGFSIMVPPDFISRGDIGNGQSFSLNGKPTTLLIWGGAVVGSFEREVGERQRWDEAEAWTIAQQVTTPRWADYGAVKGSRMVFQRMVLLCGGPDYAAFRLEYSVADAAEMAAVIDRLVPSLQAAGC